MKNLAIIEAPFNLGLIEPSPGVEPGVRKLPAHLEKLGLYDALSPVHVSRIEPPPYKMEYDEETGVRNTEEIISYSQLLSIAVSDTIKEGNFPLIIGGDCSILIGCALGLKTIGDYGLFYIDGHTDFVFPHVSVTKGAAGMDLAIVTGHAHERLANMDGNEPYMQEPNVLAFGNRYFLEKDYMDAIRRTSITYFDLLSARKAGIENTVKDFLQMVKEKDLEGFWIHLDVDVLDDNLMPCVDSRQKDGLNYEELTLCLRLLLQSGKASGMNITILDPDLDPEGVYAGGLINELKKVLVTKSTKRSTKYTK